MPRGGHNKKSIEEHIKNGTYRADRQGIKIGEDQNKTLKDIETDLNNKISKIKTELETIDMIKDIDTYKGLMSTYLSVIKSYNMLVKENGVTFIEKNEDDERLKAISEGNVVAKILLENELKNREPTENEKQALKDYKKTRK
ncbi:coiled-coil domain protein [Treponema primitia ZAS-2]|uniref:Coiled-coil domain protein n=1 Tax=Treponema primitia (strain ATCC BAA-887 / DSM 12427 / ZAS-2) TaxID=545694 RepID=F5YGJ3_TREPZ|nr:hypothetical protein [Treponema primitia]AEF85332.1 coiled-coil domain protein [Treponema primitia ZAS-2]